MSYHKSIMGEFAVIIIGSFVMLFISCQGERMEGMLIFTSVSSGDTASGIVKDGHENCFSNSRLMAIDLDDPWGKPIILTEGFAAACSPEISHDGQYLFFSAKKNLDEPWQIWLMDMNNLELRKLTSSKEDCTHPAWLPSGRIVFSMARAYPASSQNLYSCNLEGGEIRQITYHPHKDVAPTVLLDGRILTRSQQILPEIKKPVYLAIRPDGTKSELFFRSNKNWQIGSSVCEVPGGRIFFIESADDKPWHGRLASIHQNRPLYTYERISQDNEGSFHSLTWTSSGTLLTSYRPEENAVYGIYRIDYKTKEPGNLVYQQEGFHALEPVIVEFRTRAKKLPSAVKEELATGYMLCQDINVSEIPVSDDIKSPKRAVAIRITGQDGTSKDIQAEEDGSVYIELSADEPVRIYTLDEEGKVIYGPSSWLWLRPNERRGCVGCHADPELAPENRLPLAVKKPPVQVIMPGANEKTEKARP